MKKMIIGLAVVLTGVFAHGAACNWSIDFIPDAVPQTSSITAYLIDANASGYSVADMTGLLVTGDRSLLTGSGVVYSTTEVDRYVDGGNYIYAGKNKIGDGNYSPSDSAYSYYTLLIAEDGGTMTHYYVSEVLTTTVPGTGNMKMAFADQNTTVNQWVAVGGGTTGDVPEPTSGLLLIVGGALLALRRRQK